MESQKHFTAATTLRNAIVNGSKEWTAMNWAQVVRHCANAESALFDEYPRVHGRAQHSFLDLVSRVRDYARNQVNQTAA
jgi:hypothetical protein